MESLAFKEYHRGPIQYSPNRGRVCFLVTFRASKFDRACYHQRKLIGKCVHLEQWKAAIDEVLSCVRLV